MGYTAEEYKKALEIATVCLHPAGACLEWWLLEKAREEVKEYAAD